MSRRRSQASPYQRASSSSTVAIPTMVSNAQWAMVASVAVGRFSAGTSLSPGTTVLRLNPARNESSPGILMPPSMVPSGCSRP